MSNHIVVAYVQRKKITDWKRITLTRKGGPKFVYGSDDPGVFRSEVCSGSTLWIVSSLPFGWPPEMVARLNIMRMAKKDDPKLRVHPDLLRHFKYDWIAVGDPKSSKFFGHNDASRALLHTVFSRKYGLVRLGNNSDLWQATYGSKLQRPALVAEAGKSEARLRSSGAGPLEELASSSSKSIFISWKWTDNDNRQRLILDFAHGLARQGMMVWLDILALPKARALDVVQKDAPKLEKLLRYGYQECLAVVAVGSQNYGKKSAGSAKNWTLREWTGSIIPGKKMLRVVYPLDSVISDILSSADYWLRNKGPEDAALELNRWLDTRQKPNKSMERDRA